MLILLGSSTTSANAVFGLSKCEKVKNQILKYERIERPLINEWNRYANKRYTSFSNYKNNMIQKEWIELVNLEVKMYGLELNNLKCFSTTQGIVIKKNYSIWKSNQQLNKFCPDQWNGLRDPFFYKEIFWDSIYNQ